jgi:hypothetical protein
MNPLALFKAAVVAAFAFALIALAGLVRRILKIGGQPDFARADGSPRRGMIYAFSTGMLPWEKESVSDHLPTFVAGLLYHFGIFSALLLLVLVITGNDAGRFLTVILRFALLAGLISGIGLLLKRTALTKMRMISVPDDFWANLLVDATLAMALMVTFTRTAIPVFLVISAVLLVYVPFGKIRHCVFFFYTRIVFGAFFGRRGVLPHPKRES